MIEFPFIGGTYPQGSLVYSSQRTVNLYPEADQNYKNQLVLREFPGYELWDSLNDGPVRGIHTFKNHAIGVSKNVVYKLNIDGSSRQVGILNTKDGLVSMDENGTQLMLVDGKDGWIWDGGNFTQITDSTFTATKADSVTHLDSFFVVNEPGTGRIWKSESLDGLSWDVTHTATAEFKTDDVTAVWTDRELMVGGPHTIQVYYNSGASPMPFEPIRSGRIIYGIVSKDTVAIVNNSTHFLGQDEFGGIFVGRLDGYSPQRVSTRALEEEWSNYDNPQDSFAMAIHWHGHEWYVLTFNEADHGFGRTFAFDTATGMWFEVGVYRDSIGDFEKWPVTSHVYMGGRHIVGDFHGDLHVMKEGVYTFNGTTMISLRRAPVLHKNRQRLFFNSLEVDMYRGLETDSVSDPKLMLDISDDGGYTWKERRYKSMSGHASNKYDVRARFRHLGSSYDRVFQLSVSDAVPRRFLGAYIDG